MLQYKDKMSTDYFKNKLWVNIAIVVLLAAGLSTLLIFIGRNISKKTNQILTIRQELKSRLNAIQSLANLRQQSEQARANFNALQTLLPTKDDLVNIPKEFNELAKTNKIELGFSFGNETATTDSEPGFTAFNLTLSGSYDNLVKFLKALEKNRFSISFDSLDVTQDPQNQRFSALISGKIFSQ